MNGSPPSFRGRAAQVPEDWVVLGRVSGVYGIKGWLKIESHTRPREAIFDYSPWQIETPSGFAAFPLTGGRPQGQGLVAGLEGLNDRDEARAFVGATIAVPKAELPLAGEGEYYWADLVGCAVENTEGFGFGVVDHLIETGANDVLVVEGEHTHLIPYIPDVIKAVDLEARKISVAWEEDFSGDED